MDIIDTANDAVELTVSHALQNRKPPLTSINGMCRWCETEPATEQPTITKLPPYAPVNY
ncbi:hypothetical protein [Xenorhabdus bovienii]|uniref:hypothetical protein n=1 Tax=Xenorhabdus bovienii TaxID=40576 RepID=UPI003DA2EF7F